MKQKIRNNNPTNQQQLLNILKNLPTKEDLEQRFKQQDRKIEVLEKRFDDKLQQRLAETHSVLIDRILKSQDAFRNEIDHKLQNMKEEILENMAKFKSFILKIADSLVKEIEISREDREIGTAQIKRIEDDVEELKRKVVKLQQS